MHITLLVLAQFTLKSHTSSVVTPVPNPNSEIDNFAMIFSSNARRDGGMLCDEVDWEVHLQQYEKEDEEKQPNEEFDWEVQLKQYVGIMMGGGPATFIRLSYNKQLQVTNRTTDLNPTTFVDDISNFFNFFVGLDQGWQIGSTTVRRRGQEARQKTTTTWIKMPRHSSRNEPRRGVSGRNFVCRCECMRSASSCIDRNTERPKNGAASAAGEG